MSIDTHLDATPSDIATSAETVGDIKTNVDSAEDDLIGARKIIASDLEGESALSASVAITSQVSSCEDLVADLESYRTALDNLSWALSAIKTDLEGIRSRAVEGGLELAGETIIEPKGVAHFQWTDPDSTAPLCCGPSRYGPVQPSLDDAEQAKVALYSTLETDTSDIRDRETAARQDFADACSRITDGNPAVRTVSSTVSGYFVPSKGEDGWATAGNVASWGAMRASDAALLAGGVALSSTRPGVDHTLANGKIVRSHAADKGMAIGSWKNAFNDGNLTNWRIPASVTGTTGAKVATAAQKAIPALTKGSAVLSFAADAYGQWKEDSHNPSIGETEKVTRAAMKGAGSAGGAWLGVEMGAAVGACVGGPVGAAVGGIIGGVIGSGLGKMAADCANKGVHKAFIGLFH